MPKLFWLDPLEPRLFLSAASGTFVPPVDPRTVVDLDPAWRFIRSNPSGASGSSFNDSKWGNVSLPHTWNSLDGQDGGNNYYRGVGWYRRHLALSSKMKNKRIFIRFEGANTDTDFYVNGKFVGSHKGGYSAFAFDVTSFVKTSADNVLAVKVSNAADPNVAPLSADFNFDGGLYRDVKLIATNRAHVQMLDYASPGVYLTPTAVSAKSATVNVKTKLRNDNTSSNKLTIESTIVDGKGSIVVKSSTSTSIAANSGSSLTQTLKLANPRLWNGSQDPYLYTVYVTVKSAGQVVDFLSQPLGLRTFSVDPNNGFTLNGAPYDLHGVAMHQDRQDKGFAVSDADRTEDISLVQEIGATFVRLSHYPHDQTTYDLLDRAGLVTWSEVPLINYVQSSSSFASNAKQQVTEMIRQNYNHPSVFFWGLFNEIPDNAKTATLIPQLNTLAHGEDHTRLTTGATSLLIPDSSPQNSYTDLIASNRYFGWYQGTTDDLGAFIDDFHKENPNRPFGISEYGAGASIDQHAENPKNVVPTGTFHPEEYQALLHEQSWAQLAARPFLWIKTVWNMFDFAADQRNEGDTPGRNDKGLVTYDRKTRKDAFYFYKANWSDQKFVYITSRRWTDRTDAQTDVKVYSNLDSVELFVNGESQGVLKSSNHIFIWHDVTLSEGKNTIEAVPLSKTPVDSDVVTWNLTAPEPQNSAPLPAVPKPLQFSLWKDLNNGQSEEE